MLGPDDVAIFDRPRYGVRRGTALLCLLMRALLILREEMMLSGWMRLSLTSQVVDDLRELLYFLCVDSLISRAVWQIHLLSEVSFSLSQIWKSSLNHDTAAI